MTKFPLPLSFIVFYIYIKYRALGCVSLLKSEIGLKIRIWILVKKRTLRFFDEDDYEYEIFSILSIAQAVAQAWTSVILAGKRDNRRHSTTGFSENDQRECRSAGSKLSNVRSFITLRSGEGLTSISINNRTDLYNEVFRGVRFFEDTRKNFKSVKSRTRPQISSSLILEVLCHWGSSVRRILDSFYLLISKFEKLST